MATRGQRRLGINAANRYLGHVQAFLDDPGTPAGGSFDWRAPTSGELAARPDAIASRNPGYRPNSVAIVSHNYTGSNTLDQLQTLVHEPLHVFGVSRPSVDGVEAERYRADAAALAQMRGGTTAAICNNADNYACLVYPGNC